MDTLAIASLATDISQARTENAVQLTVLKKAMDIQAEGAMQLVQAAAQAAQYRVAVPFVLNLAVCPTSRLTSRA